MSDFIVRPALSGAVKEQYGIDTTVYKRVIDKDTYEVKIVYGEKECVLKEVMDNGLTKTAYATYNGVEHEFPEYYMAEKAGIRWLQQ